LALTRFVVSSLFLCSWLALAQDVVLDAGVEEDAPPDESQVTSQVASFAVTKLKDSPAVVTVVTAQEIRETGARDLVDVLLHAFDQGREPPRTPARPPNGP